MIYSDFINQVNDAYRGTDDDAPSLSTPDYNMWLRVTNRKIQEWARDSKNTWQSLFEAREVGTVAFGTQVYELEDEFLTPANGVTISPTGNPTSYIKYTLVKPEERNNFYNSVYISGREPKLLTFNDTFNADGNYIGGTINLAAYFMPDEITDPSDDIPVDDPMWLVYAVASELAFNDLSYSDKSPDLVGKANFLYSQMAAANRKGVYGNPRVAPTNVNRIRGNRYVYGSDGDYS